MVVVVSKRVLACRGQGADTCQPVLYCGRRCERDTWQSRKEATAADGRRAVKASARLLLRSCQRAGHIADLEEQPLGGAASCQHRQAAAQHGRGTQQQVRGRAQTGARRRQAHTTHTLAAVSTFPSALVTGCVLMVLNLPSAPACTRATDEHAIWRVFAKRGIVMRTSV